MLYNGYLVAMETYVTLFVSMQFSKVPSIGAINEFRKHASIDLSITQPVEV